MPSERFLIRFIEIPALQKRLECLEFRSQYAIDEADMEDNLETLQLGIDGIGKNKKLMAVIKMILKIGNYLNHGTNKGKATGFSI